MSPWVAVSGSTIGHGITVNVDARARRAAAAVVAVRPDPAADAGFVGRDRELAALLAMLAPHPVPEDGDSAAAGGVVVVSAVAGAPGVGKTALAQAAARAAVARGWFPGGAVTVDLHGYDPDPLQVVGPAQLYASLLRALGVPGEQVPPKEHEQATVYHQVFDQLAAAGRAVLLVLDNVGDPDQVAPVLPHSAGPHRVLITSRDSLAAIPQARLLDLHVLDDAAAVELLAVGLRRRHPADQRVTDEPAAAARLVELCGRLPLAVQIVAALLGDEPDRPLTELETELADEGHRLRALDYDRRWAVRAAFDLSHRRLDPAAAELFALLAAVPGPDVGLAVAAAVADRDEHSARTGLRALCRAHLLDQQPSASQQQGQAGQRPRWRMHDLIRLYATEHLTPHQRHAGFTRALTHYRHTLDLARRRFTALPARAASVPAGFATPTEAMSWVLAERAGLVAAVVHGAATHPGAGPVNLDAARLVADLGPFLDRARLLEDWVTIAAAAVHATTGSTDRTAVATAWNDFGAALREVRRFDEAVTALEQARELFREAGDRHGEGMAWGNLGAALLQLQRLDEAITALEQAREVFRETGNRRREAMAWNNLGLALAAVRRFDEAITAQQQAGDLFRETGDRHGEGTAWNNLGAILREVRRFDEAITALEQARELYRETGDRHGEAKAATNLGAALSEVRRFDEAIIAHEQAQEIHQETGDRHGAALAWGNLGAALREVRRFDEAIIAHRQAREIHREVGDRHGEGVAWGNLGVALVGVRRFDEAITAFEHAREHYRETGDRHREASALNNLAVALRPVQRFDEAITALEQAIALFVEFADHYGHAQALENLGLVHAELNHPQPARCAWAEAIELYTVVGAQDDAERVRRRLAGLDDR